MTDHELTRLAYKAAFSGAELTDDKDMMRHWSPLTDDGDALRLAVELGSDISFCDSNTIQVVAFDTTNKSTTGVALYENEGGDPCAAVRRAIVRAAAEIGKAMP